MPVDLLRLLAIGALAFAGIVLVVQAMIPMDFNDDIREAIETNLNFWWRAATVVACVLIVALAIFYPYQTI